MRENPTYKKAISFAIRIVNVHKYLKEEKSEWTMSEHKLAIAQKEANETLYWLDLLKETDYLTDKQYESLNADCTELHKIITSIILTTKENRKQKS